MMRLVAAVAVVLAIVGSAAAQPKKPKLPPGLDPGGVAIVLLTTGIDYTKPELAVRLARDGEGELIGWDAVDGDNRPYGTGGAGTALALTLGQAPGTRIIPIRIDPDNQATLATALGLVARMPARIVVVPFVGPAAETRAKFLSAAERLGDRFFIVPADSESGTEGPAAARENGNVLRVAVAPEASPDLARSAGDVRVRVAMQTPQNVDAAVANLIPALLVCGPADLAQLAAASPKTARLIGLLPRLTGQSKPAIEPSCPVSAPR